MGLVLLLGVSSALLLFYLLAYTKYILPERSYVEEHIKHHKFGRV